MSPSNLKPIARVIQKEERITGKKTVFKALILLFILASSLTCQQAKPEIRIGLNPWPGYDFLYLAERKNFFAEAGLNVRIIQYSSLADVQRAFSQGQIDGMGSTLIEFVEVALETNKNAKICFITDYSHGADVILAKPEIAGVKDLANKRVGLELHSLGIFMLARALEISGLSLNDVTMVNVEQLNLEQAYDSGSIDAAVSYPPHSVALTNKGAHAIFDSSLIPEEVVDIVSLDARVLEANPDIARQLLEVWDRAVEWSEANQEEAYGIMADRSRISIAEFKEALGGLQTLKSEDQPKLLQPGGPLEHALQLVQSSLRTVGLIERTESPQKFIHRGP